MNDLEITDLPDGTFDLHLGEELIGNFATHREAIRAAFDLEEELIR